MYKTEGESIILLWGIKLLNVPIVEKKTHDLFRFLVPFTSLDPSSDCY